MSTYADTETGEIVTGQVVPFDASLVEQAADPGRFVELACERAKEWLAQALAQGDIEGIVELKSQAEAIRTYTAQKQLGKDAELSAQEIVRRAERGIGLAIRKGQEAGVIHAHGGQTRDVGVTDIRSVSDSTGMPRDAVAELYPLVDDVTDEAFEEAVTEAKAEGNLSRANVARKAKREPGKRKWSDEAFAETIRDLSSRGYTSGQIAAELEMTEPYVRERSRKLGVTITADEITRKTRRLDSDRIVTNMATTLEGLALSAPLVTLTDLDPDQIEHWATSLTDSLRTLQKFHKQIKEMAQ